MASKLIDLYHHLIKYNNDVIFIAFHSKTQEPKEFVKDKFSR